MNIWVIGRSYPQKINNMQGSFELEQAKMLAKHGHKVSYISCVYHPFKKIKKWGYCHWNEDGIDIFTYSQVFTIERMKVHFESFKKRVWGMLFEKIKKETGSPNVIHVHYPSNITIANQILEYQKNNTKIICTEHWSQVLNQIIDQYERKQLKTYADRADAFLCVSPTLRQSVLEITKTNRELFVVPNIINSIFKPLTEKKSNFTFIVVGALFPNKQFDKVIIAFVNKFKGQENVNLTIVGGGPEEKKLKKLCTELGVDNQIKLTGKLTRKETAYEIAISHCLICYSKSETFGVPIIESWACGLPVIATTAASVRDGWDDQLGLQVSPDKLNELENSMDYVFNNYNNYNSEYISNYSFSNYSEEVVYNMLINFYYVTSNEQRES